MKKLFFIAIGGFLGATLRYIIKSAPSLYMLNDLPLNILLINIIGSFVLSFILTLPFEVLPIKPWLRLGITTGFLGAFTTFSTLCKEAVTLIYYNISFSAIYVILSACIGLTAAYLGFVSAKKIALLHPSIKQTATPDLESEE